MDKKQMYRNCVVPRCKNTTSTTPEKYFFYIPNDEKLRKIWCNAMRRPKQLSPKTSRYCCEDHFDIETDTENLIQYKLVGGRLRLKKDVVPHKFDCQRFLTKGLTRSAFDKRRRREYLQRVLRKSVCQEGLTHPIELVQCDTEEMAIPEEILPDRKEMSQDKCIEFSQPETAPEIKFLEINIDSMASHFVNPAETEENPAYPTPSSQSRDTKNPKRFKPNREDGNKKIGDAQQTERTLKITLKKTKPNILRCNKKAQSRVKTGVSVAQAEAQRAPSMTELEPPKDEFYFFAMSIAAQLRALPLNVALELQVLIQDQLHLARKQSLYGNGTKNNDLINESTSPQAIAINTKEFEQHPVKIEVDSDGGVNNKVDKLIKRKSMKKPSLPELEEDVIKDLDEIDQRATRTSIKAKHPTNKSTQIKDTENDAVIKTETYEYIILKEINNYDLECRVERRDNEDCDSREENMDNVEIMVKIEEGNDADVDNTIEEINIQDLDYSADDNDCLVHRNTEIDIKEEMVSEEER